MDTLRFSAKWVLLGILALTGLSGCKKDEPDPPNPFSTTPYPLQIPPGFPDMVIPDDNPLTVEGVALGRMLYYDDILSTNGKACSSCHFQELGFSSPLPGPGNRSIMAHINLGWNQYFGWEGGEHLLDLVPLADLADGNDFLEANGDSLLVRLRNNPTYQHLFREAFNIDITEVSRTERDRRIAQALAQFMRTLISCNSRFDKRARGEAGSDFTLSEINGMGLFFTEKGDCFHCHGYPLMSDGLLHNNGLDSVFTAENDGLYGITGNPADMGKFRVPTLRNIELTAPYMHDGRFATLEEVIEFYDSGMYRHGNTDPLLMKPRSNLNAQEKADLVAFLKTLTDTSFTNNPNFGPPN